MNKIERRLFYERIMRNLKVGDTVERNDKDKEEGTIIKIIECGNRCPVFEEREGPRPPEYSCARKCFILEEDQNNFKGLRQPKDLYSNCIYGDGFIAYINGKKIYTQKEREDVVLKGKNIRNYEKNLR